MLDAGGGKQHLVGSEGLPRARTDKLARALGDDVKLILRMRRLLVGSARRVELYYHRAVLEQQDRLLALWSRQTLQRGRKIYLKTLVESHDDAGIIHYNAPAIKSSRANELPV